MSWGRAYLLCARYSGYRNGGRSSGDEAEKGGQSDGCRGMIVERERGKRRATGLRAIFFAIHILMPLRFVTAAEGARVLGVFLPFSRLFFPYFQ